MESNNNFNNNSDANKIEIWNSFRNEINRNQDFINKLVFSTVGLNFAIYSFSLNSRDSISSVIFVMLPLLITLISNYWLHLKIRSGLRIVKYIREVLEESDQPSKWINWETRLKIFRQKSQSGKVEFQTIDGNKKSKGIQKTIYTYIFTFFYISSPLMAMWILINPEGKILLFKSVNTILFKILYLFIPSLISAIIYVIQNIVIERVNKQIRKESELSFK